MDKLYNNYLLGALLSSANSSQVKESRKIPSLEKGKEFASLKYKQFNRNAFSYAGDAEDIAETPGDVRTVPHKFANPEHQERVELVAKMLDFKNKSGFGTSDEFNELLDYHHNKIARGVEKSVTRRLKKRQALPGQALDPYRHEPNMRARISAQRYTAGEGGNPSVHPNRPPPLKYEPIDPFHDMIDHGYSGATPSGWGEIPAEATARQLVPSRAIKRAEKGDRDFANRVRDIGGTALVSSKNLTMQPYNWQDGPDQLKFKSRDHEDLILQARTLDSRHFKLRRENPKVSKRLIPRVRSDRDAYRENPTTQSELKSRLLSKHGTKETSEAINNLISSDLSVEEFIDFII